MQRSRTRSSTLVAIGVLIFGGTGVAADTEIHRCMGADDTVSFQETPCPKPAVHVDNGSELIESNNENGSPDADDNSFDFPNPFDEPVSPPTSAEPALPKPPSLDRAECEKTTRDAIDAVDLEMRANAYTKEQGEEFLGCILMDRHRSAIRLQ